jgi:hypothetical protein
MFCPNCHAEYVPGVKECPDCRELLLERLPDVPPPIEFEEILRTFNLGDIALIKSILENAEIEYFFRGEIFNQVDPLIQPARLSVRTDQAHDAKELLKNMNVSFLGLSTREDDSQLAD